MRLGVGFVLVASLFFVSCDENSTSNQTVNSSSTSNVNPAGNLSQSGNQNTTAAVPNAKYTFTPLKGDIQTRYKFNASGSVGDITNFAWDFGDGKTGTGENVQHRFRQKGRYKVRLTVSDGQNSDVETKTIRVRQEVGDDDDGGGEGQKCNYTDPPRDVWFFKVLSNNPAQKTIIAEFRQPAGCDDVFYLCGDVRIGGIEPGEREYWIGTICEMWNLGNNRYRIHLVDGRYWVDNGETGTYVWPQYDCNPSVACRDFGY